MKTNQNLESIFAEAIELADPTNRGAFLDDACGGDAGLRNRVGKLLAANRRSAAFMNEPAAILNLPDSDELDKRGDELVDRLDQIGEQPGDDVGRYKLIDLIGEGGMGSVFRAEQTEPVRREVALKVVKPGMDTKEVVARFESERQSLALMSHANIASVLDVGATDQGRPFFVMELVDGVPITDYCNDTKLTSRQRLELFVPICHAIQHAHQKGVIHRDIKPTNVMVSHVDGKSTPKVIDFGIAKATDQTLTQSTMLTRQGEFIGTPAYMSPEQASVANSDIDTRSDVYSLGALLYELLTGTAPFDREKLKTLPFDELRRVIREENPLQPSAAIQTVSNARSTTIAAARRSTPQELKSQLKGELDWIVMRALEKDRDRRYDSASSLAADILRYLNNETVVARPPTSAYLLKKFLSRNRVAVGTFTAIATTLVAATIFSGWMAFNANRNMETLTEHVDFMNAGLFAQADPLSEPNRDVKLREVLDRASQELAKQPIQSRSVEAAIRSTIGETYRGLGEYETSETHLKRAYQLSLAEYGASHRKTIETGSKLASTLLALAKFDDAKTLLDEQFALAKKKLSSDDELRLTIQKLTASRLEAVGDYGQAEKLLRDLMERRQEKFGSEHPATYEAMANVAYVLQSQRRHGEALTLLSAAHQGMMQANDQWHPAALKITSNLASLHSARNEDELAEAIYTATLPKLIQQLGANHPQTLTAKHGLAVLRFTSGNQSDVAEAKAVLSEVLTSQKEQLGESHPSTLMSMHNLALVHKSLGEFSDAERLLMAELELCRKSAGSDHTTTQNALSSLAFFHLDQGHFAEAIPYYEELSSSLSIAAASAVVPDPNSIIALTMLGLCRNKTGDYQQAKQDLNAAFQASESSMPDHWLTHIVSSQLGEVNLKLNQRNEAEDALLAGYEGLRLHEPNVPSRWKPLGLRAATRRLAEFYESAESRELQSRAVPYREELKALRSNSIHQNGQTGNTEDGDPN